MPKKQKPKPKKSKATEQVPQLVTRRSQPVETAMLRRRGESR